MSRNLFLLTAILALGLFRCVIGEEASIAFPKSPTAKANIGKEQFLDDHSNSLQLLRSYYNAINRQEYVRAYYYWNLSSKDTLHNPQHILNLRQATSTQALYD